jgi:aspartyl-tRNA(Asn)/glutamyl-tRNA(Gln) amidotransferase subunit B
MEEGSLRCDANVSVRPKGQETFGTRTELKNMNSFRNVERALEFEVERQIELIESGGEVVQETLLWDANKLETRSMRSKEEAHDYRYFPEPDIPPVVVTDEMLQSIKNELPEMPDVRRQRFMSEFEMSEDDAHTLTEDRYLADYFEDVLAHTNSPKAVSNIILAEVLRVLNDQSIEIDSFPISTARLAGLVQLREDDKINSSAMTEIFDVMLEEEKPAEKLAKEMNLMQVSDQSFIEPIVEGVIENHPDEVERFRDGKKGLIGFFIGQVMQQSRGKANPNLVRELVTKRLNGE